MPAIGITDELKLLIQDETRRAINEKLFPGCVIGIAKPNHKWGLPHDDVFHESILSYGSFTYDPHARSMFENALFDIASITKTIVAMLALRLVSQGKLSLSDPVKNYIPELSGAYTDRAIIKDLLTFTIELDLNEENVDFRKLNRDQIWKIITTCGLKEIPGKMHKYRNTTTLFLGKVIEAITGKKLDEYTEIALFKPLGMTMTTWNPRKYDLYDIVPTEVDPWRGRCIHGEIHDELSHIFSEANEVIGAAGIFSTVPDLMKFAKMIVLGGKFGRYDFFEERSTQKRLMISNIMRQNNISDIPGHRYGLGWDKHTLHKEYSRCKCFENEAILITGFTGCSLRIHAERGYIEIILSNAVHPKRNKGSLFEFRRTIAHFCTYCSKCNA